MKLIAPLAALLFAAVVPADPGHILWATCGASGRYAVELSTSPGFEVDPKFKADVSRVKAFSSQKPVVLAVSGDAIVATSKDPSFAAALSSGVVDGRWTVFEAKAARDVTASQKSEKLHLELSVLSRSGEDVRVRVSLDSKPAKGVGLLAIVNSGDDEIAAKTSADGTTTISIPEDQPIILHAFIEVPVKGTASGVPYTRVRYDSTLTIPASGPG